jgi:hypothetical protein
MKDNGCNIIFLIFLKGTVARDFWPLVFFHESTPYGPLIHTPKHFRILVRILGDIQISKLFCGAPQNTKKLSDRGLFKHGSYMPWVM